MEHKIHEHGNGEHANHAGHDMGAHAGGHMNHHEMMAADFKRRFLWTLVLAIPILIMSPTIQEWGGFMLPQIPFADYILFALASVVAIYGGWPFYTASLSELKSRNYGMMTLVSVAVISGYLFSAASTFVFEGVDFYWEIATLVAVLLFGHWIEMRAVIGTGGALKELAKLIPPRAHILRGGEIVEIDTTDIKHGDRVVVKPGEKIPIDGIVSDGQANVNEAMITGESKPVLKKRGDGVVGGAINFDGSLTIDVTKTGEETALSQIMELIRRAQESKPRAQKIADRAANYLTLAAIVGGGATFVYWGIFSPQGVVFALTLAITVVVIACPHALGLAIPTVTTITTSIAARHGILVKDMSAMELAKNLDYIVFDKTGTLTKGEFAVTKIAVAEGEDENKILGLAASVDTHSLHSIAKAVVEEAKRRGISFSPAGDFKSLSGRGAIGRVSGEEVAVGSVALMKELGADISALAENADKISADGGSLVWIAVSGKARAVFGLSDVVRAEAREVLMGLKKIGIEPVMLTGDNQVVAEDVARSVGIERFFAEVLPEDKVEKIKELQVGGKTVAMVGDGINDAPSLTQADIGIAIGAGTDVAIESAELVLVKNNLKDVLSAINLSKRTMAKMKQNLAWAAGYNIIAIPIAAGVLYPFGILLRPEWGALLMSASSVIVVLNALTLRRFSA